MNLLTPKFTGEGSKIDHSPSTVSSSGHRDDEDTLPETDELFRSLFDQAATGIAVSSESGRFLRVNGAFCRMTGYNEEELRQKTFQDITHPDDIESNEHFRRQLFSGNSDARTHDKRYLRKDGSQISVQIVVTVVRGRPGVPRCSVSVIHDITAHKQAQQALRAGEERFRRMVEMGSDWYWEQDAQFRFLELPGFEKTNFNPQDAVGKARWELSGLGPLPGRAWEQHRAKLERHEPFSDFVFLRYDKSGELRYLSVSGDPVFDGDGNFKGYRGIGKDMTGQARAHKAIEESEARYRTLFHVHPHSMWVVDSKTLAFLAVNEAAVKHYGYSREEFLAMTADQLRPDDDVSQLLSAFKDKSDSYMHRVWRHVTKSGELIDVQIVSFNFEFDGRPARLGVVTDITERLKADERARKIDERYQLLLKGPKRSASFDS
jgi:PAS domain S-box-containing protein